MPRLCSAKRLVDAMVEEILVDDVFHSSSLHKEKDQGAES
jgi:hypothetical protein